MKKAFILLLAFILIFTGCSKSDVKEDTGKVEYRIGVSKMLAHPALDAVEKGMKDHLDKSGLRITYDFQNAQGEISSCASIAQKFKDDGCDVVLGIATPTAQSLVNIFYDTPVVFSAVTDPVDAGLVETYDPDPDSNVCGVSDMNPVEEQIKLLMDVTGAKVIGNIYASGEANGVILMEQAKAAVEKLGGTFVEVSVANSAEVKMAAQSIIDRVDAIYIATDNTVISALAAFDDVCNKNGKALFSADPTATEGLEALIAWGFDYYALGLKTGEAIESIIKGASAGQLGTIFLTDPKDFDLRINLDTAKKLGLDISDDVKAKAAIIIENGEIIEK